MRLPKYRTPTHPGEVLLKEFLEPYGLTQKELARRIGVSYPRVNELVHGKRGVTPDTALRLARLFGLQPHQIGVCTRSQQAAALALPTRRTLVSR